MKKIIITLTILLLPFVFFVFSSAINALLYFSFSVTGFTIVFIDLFFLSMLSITLNCIISKTESIALFILYLFAIFIGVALHGTSIFYYDFSPFPSYDRFIKSHDCC